MIYPGFGGKIVDDGNRVINLLSLKFFLVTTFSIFRKSLFIRRMCVFQTTIVLQHSGGLSGTLGRLA